MLKTIVATTLALAAFSVGSEARAAGWGLHSGDTMGPGENMIYGELGWPDLSLGFQHGVSDKVDVGFKFSLIYGAEYTTYTTVGIGMGVPIRISPIKRDKFSFQIHVNPGIKFDSFGEGCGLRNDFLCGGLRFGLWIPFGLEFGLHLSREATLSFGMEMPIYINLTNGGFGQVPLLFGPGFEYHVDEHIALGVNTKFGPSLHVVNDRFGNSYNAADFGVLLQGFFAYRL